MRVRVVPVAVVVVFVLMLFVVPLAGLSWIQWQLLHFEHPPANPETVKGKEKDQNHHQREDFDSCARARGLLVVLLLRKLTTCQTLEKGKKQQVKK